MTRRLLMWGVAGILAASTGVRAAETLRIVPIVSGDEVVVSFELADAYTEQVRETIASGLRTTFTYQVELRMMVPAWVDRTIASAIVSTTDQYDNLTRRHSLSRTVDGHVAEASITEDETTVRQWLTKWTRLPLIRTANLDPNRDYYVRISARARPHGASLLGWATTTTGTAKFTFIP